MTTEYTERSISGLRSYADAVAAAASFSEMFGERFVVLHYLDERVFDVEPARERDRLGLNGVVAITTFGRVQEFNPSVD